MDILYVHPAKQEVDARYDKYVSCAPYPFIPVGVVGLVNLLRSEGWSVQGLNLPMELTRQPGFDFRGWLAAQAPPKMVMVDLHWYEHSFGALEVARAVKTVWPQVKLVIGGLTTTFFAEEILTHFRDVDFAIRGDAEEPLRHLARVVCGGRGDLAETPNLLYREGTAIRQTTRSYFARSEDLDALDFVTTDWLHHAASYAAIQYSGAGRIQLHDPKLQGHWLTIGRGCVFNCIYCGGGKHSHQELAGRTGYVVRSPEKVAADVERLAAQGRQQVALSLDPATFKPDWWQTFFQQLRARQVRIGIYNEFFQLPSKEFIDALGETADLRHTEVAISPLSGDEEVRRRNGKFYSNERFLRMLETLREYQVPIFVYFSLNLPGETFQTFKR
ncbi:MAG TPA: radical SAM protein, partial [Caldilineaceae bacterium]|nr:radical SAM protein [Caldilineaceae bacterium]